MNEIREEFNRHIRNNFIKEHPLCQYCGEKAEHIHHLIPIARGGDNRQSNLIPLCAHCHGLIHDIKYNNSKLIKAGIAKAKAEGKYQNRKTKPRIPKPENWLVLRQQILEEKITQVEIAKQYSVSKTTVHNWLKEEV